MSGYLGSYLAITGIVINFDYNTTAGKNIICILIHIKPHSQWRISSTLNIYTWTQNFLFDGDSIERLVCDMPMAYLCNKSSQLWTT